MENLPLERRWRHVAHRIADLTAQPYYPTGLAWCGVAAGIALAAWWLFVDRGWWQQFGAGGAAMLAACCGGWLYWNSEQRKTRHGELRQLYSMLAREGLEYDVTRRIVVLKIPSRGGAPSAPADRE